MDRFLTPAILCTIFRVRKPCLPFPFFFFCKTNHVHLGKHYGSNNTSPIIYLILLRSAFRPRLGTDPLILTWSVLYPIVGYQQAMLAACAHVSIQPTLLVWDLSHMKEAPSLKLVDYASASIPSPRGWYLPTNRSNSSRPYQSPWQMCCLLLFYLAFKSIDHLLDAGYYSSSRGSCTGSCFCAPGKMSCQSRGHNVHESWGYAWCACKDQWESALNR